MKKLCLSILLASELLIGFILIYFNLIAPEYEGHLGTVLTVIALILFLSSLLGLSFLSSRGPKTHDRVEQWLGALAFLPLILLFSVPLLLVLLIVYPVYSFRNRMYKKAKVLIDKGFTFRARRIGKKKIFELSRDRLTVRIERYRSYEISTDGKEHFESLTTSSFLSEEERKEAEALLTRFVGCDPRDADEYEPTEGLLLLIARHV
ncbi:MAG: hypothetical protein IKC63_05200 [Clostridia bacterium]|nr:hypothetical protein [Clostridia bacterium]